jgi:molybdenum cofactor biosynthesis enzyme MoaA
MPVSNLLENSNDCDAKSVIPCSKDFNILNDESDYDNTDHPDVNFSNKSYNENYHKENYVTEIFSILNKMGKYYKVNEIKGSGPAIYYKLKNSMGSIGFITNDRDSCRHCNRIRLTPYGTVRLCLFSNLEYNIKNKMRNGYSYNNIKKEIIELIRVKPENRDSELKDYKGSREKTIIKVPDYMNKIGG